MNEVIEGYKTLAFEAVDEDDIMSEVRERAGR